MERTGPKSLSAPPTPPPGEEEAGVCPAPRRQCPAGHGYAEPIDQHELSISLCFDGGALTSPGAPHGVIWTEGPPQMDRPGAPPKPPPIRRIRSSPIKEENALGGFAGPETPTQKKSWRPAALGHDIGQILLKLDF